MVTGKSGLYLDPSSLRCSNCPAFSSRRRLQADRTLVPFSRIFVIALCFLSFVSAQAQRVSPLVDKHQIAHSLRSLPLPFEPNRGQTDRRVRYRARGNGYELFLTDSEAVLALMHDRIRVDRKNPSSKPKADLETSTIRMRLDGAKPVAIQGENSLSGTLNYITGSDPAKWRTSIQTYAQVRYAGIYPGVDLIYYGNDNRLEYDFIVAPGADANQIRMSFVGTSGLHLDEDGNLILDCEGCQLSLNRPVVYQEINATRHPVEGSFQISRDNTVAFALGEYDHSKPLVIDPVLAYSTYLGGGFFDAIQTVTVDQSGNAYVAGVAYSCDFPTTPGSYAPVSPNCNASQGLIFVTKLNPQGTGLVYSTFVTDGNLLSSGYAWAITVDGSGNAYVAGDSGVGLPVTPGAFQPVNNAAANVGINGFVLKLNASGTALLYSTYLGGSFGGDAVRALAIDSSGNAYLAGTAISSDFPATPGAFQTTPPPFGTPYTFVSKLNATGTALVYSTYLLGNGAINPFSGPKGQANGIAVDSVGNAYVVGLTGDLGFPVTPGAFQTNYSTNPANLALFRFTGYITKLDATGAHEIYASYLGGDYMSEARAVAVDSLGSAYVTGWTTGGNITTPGAFQTVATGLDAYVVKVNPSGSSLTYATYLGGSCLSAPLLAGDAGDAITLDGAGDAYIAGQACSADFPVTTNAIQTTLEGSGTNYSAFLSELNSAGSTLLFSTYIGGSYSGDWATGIGLDGQKNAYIAGLTHSFSFPTTPGAFQAQNRASDQGTGFVSKFTIPTGGQLLVHDFALILSASAASISRGQSTSTNVTITPTNGFYQAITFSCSGLPSWAYCSFSTPSVAPGTSTAMTTLTVSTSAATNAATAPGLPSFSMVSVVAGLALLGGRQRRAFKVFALGIILGTFLMNGCGGGNGGGGPNPNSFTVTIIGSAPSVQHAATFTVTAN
jgi:hypothetical protein